jgi:hypothetical protein
MMLLSNLIKRLENLVQCEKLKSIIIMKNQVSRNEIELKKRKETDKKIKLTNITRLSSYIFNLKV